MKGRGTLALLAGLGVAELAICLYGAHAQNLGRINTSYAAALVQGIPYALAGLVVWWARPGKRLFGLAMGFALAFRLVAGFGPQPYLSTDVYRYVWDGRVQAAGINPYRYPPNDPALTFLRDAEVFPKINRAGAPTIYPPGAEALYFVAGGFGRGGVGTTRLTMVLLELAAVLALGRLLDGFGFPRQRLLLYAWHPLPIWEFAGSGHVDAAVVACIALALLAQTRGRMGRAGLMLAGATLVKLFPVAVFPALYRRWGWRLPVVLAVTVTVFYLPHLWVVGWRTVFDFLLNHYTSEEGLENGDRFFLLGLVQGIIGRTLPTAGYTGFAALVLGGLAAWCLWKPASDALGVVRRAAGLAVAFNVLLSPGYPWYFTWLIPFLVFVPRPSLIWLTCGSFVLYANWLHTEQDDAFLIACVHYLPAAALALAELVWPKIWPRIKPGWDAWRAERRPQIPEEIRASSASRA